MNMVALRGRRGYGYGYGGYGYGYAPVEDKDGEKAVHKAEKVSSSSR
jgi:hypothetical protein